MMRAYPLRGEYPVAEIPYPAAERERMSRQAEKEEEQRARGAMVAVLDCDDAREAAIDMLRANGEWTDCNALCRRSGLSPASLVNCLRPLVKQEIVQRRYIKIRSRRGKIEPVSYYKWAA